MALNKEMMKQFKDKFGDDPIYFKGGMTLSHHKYVTWVEDLAVSNQARIEKLEEANKNLRIENDCLIERVDQFKNPHKYI